MNKKTFYITTPIYYVNDVPHIGHAYTTIAADVMARWRRLQGDKVFFLTGTDEHGQKIQAAAQAKGETPIELADRMSGQFKALWERLNISNDDFIRTTEPRHIEAVQALFKKLYENGDIYLGVYEDWYCVPDETFWTEGQLAEGNKCPECGRPTIRLKEENYFFRLSKYQQRLLEFIESDPYSILPTSRRNEVLSFIYGGLKDLSITRQVSNVEWGIPVPLEIEQKTGATQTHTIYVWLDALTNYLTAAGYPDNMERFNQIWPADIHLMSKDILRFHAVYWPAFLMSAGFKDEELPKQVVVHGWWTVEGKKMSKSLGNVVDPNLMVDHYGVDAFRYFLMREINFGYDGDFSEKALVDRLNSDLVNDLGNLVSRSLVMLDKYYQRIVPEPALNGDNVLQNKYTECFAEIESLYQTLSFNKILVKIWEFVYTINKYIDQTSPWTLSKDESQRARLGTVMYNIAEAIRLIGIMIWPFMPQTATQIWYQLGIKEGLDNINITEANGPGSWGWLKPGTKTVPPSVAGVMRVGDRIIPHLFTRMEIGGKRK